MQYNYEISDYEYDEESKKVYIKLSARRRAFYETFPNGRIVVTDCPKAENLGQELYMSEARVYTDGQTMVVRGNGYALKGPKNNIDGYTRSQSAAVSIALENAGFSSIPDIDFGTEMMIRKILADGLENNKSNLSMKDPLSSSEAKNTATSQNTSYTTDPLSGHINSPIFTNREEQITFNVAKEKSSVSEPAEEPKKQEKWSEPESIEDDESEDNSDEEDCIETTVRECLPITDEKVIRDILNEDKHFKVKKSEIKDFYKSHTNVNERIDFIKTVFNDEYTELLLDKTDNTRYGYKTNDDGLYIWKGSYLTRSMASDFSWEMIQYIYEEMFEQEKLSDTDNEGQTGCSEVDEQLTLFGDFTTTEDTANAKSSKVKKKDYPAFQITEAMLDHVLRCGSTESASLERIVAWFQKDRAIEESVEFLKEEFSTDGRGYIFTPPNSYVTYRYCSWFDENGITIAAGEYIDNPYSKLKVSWEDAALRIRQLLDEGRFCSQDIIDSAAEKEIKDIAENLWHLHQDIGYDNYEYFIPNEMFKGGFPDSSERIKLALLDKDTLRSYIDGLTQFVADYEQNRNILRYHFHRPKELLYRLKGLQIERRKFITKPDFVFKGHYFISEREKDALLGFGSGFSDGKFRIKKFFEENHSLPDQIQFLKKEYGTGGGSRRGGWDNHDTKGIVYQRGESIIDYDCEVTMKWSEVAERIACIISEGRYITQKEIDDKIRRCKSIVQNYDKNSNDVLDGNKERYEEALGFLRENDITDIKAQSLPKDPVDILFPITENNNVC